MFARFPWFTHFSARRLEYITAVYTSAVGAFLALPVTSMDTSAGIAHATELMSERAWATVFIALGLASLWSLHVNRSAAWTPFARLISSGLSMLAFAALASAFLAAQPESLGFCAFACSAFLFCGNCVLSAARDVGQEISRWRGGRNDD